MRWYDHGDLEDMERVLVRVGKEMAKKPLTRRFIVTEALFEDVGDLVDLPRIVRFAFLSFTRLPSSNPPPLVQLLIFPPSGNGEEQQIELKHRHKFRLILDETHSIGVLGRSGRGLPSHQNIDPLSVDMIVGSLAGPLCAGGGFCAGSAEIVEHQRISASAYTYSAALPAMLATTASETVAMLQREPELLTALRENVRALWAQLDPRSEWVRATSWEANPVVVLVLKEDVCRSRRWAVQEQEAVLQDVVDEVSGQQQQQEERLGPSLFFFLMWFHPQC